MGIFALVGMMLFLAVALAVVEGGEQLLHRIKEESRFRRMLKGI